VGLAVEGVAGRVCAVKLGISGRLGEIVVAHMDDSPSVAAGAVSVGSLNEG